ncbi:MAG: dTMP kinase [Thermoplasmata archaeon]
MPKFIVLEGIDGSGKSSVKKALPERLGTENLVLTEEPTDTWLGEAVRKSHREKVNPFTEAFLFIADRAAHSELIRGWLGQGKNVICDRYYHSTVAYQSAALEGTVDFDPVPWLLSINRKVSIEPDLVFLFRIDPKVALSRLKNRNELSKFEQIGFLEKVAANYDRLTELCRNIVVIDASQPFEEVILEVMSNLYGNI